MDDAEVPTTWKPLNAVEGFTPATWLEKSERGPLRWCSACGAFWHVYYDPKEMCYTRTERLGTDIGPLLRSDTPVERVWDFATRSGETETLVQDWLQWARYDPEESLQHFVAEIGRHLRDGAMVIRLSRCIRMVIFGQNPVLKKRLAARTDRAPIFRVPNAAPLAQVLEVEDLFRDVLDYERTYYEERLEKFFESFCYFAFRPSQDWIEVDPSVRRALVARFPEGDDVPPPVRESAPGSSGEESRREEGDYDRDPEPAMSVASWLGLGLGTILLCAGAGRLFGLYTVGTASWEQGAIAAAAIGLAYAGVVYLSGCRRESVAVRGALFVTIGVVAFGHLTFYEREARRLHRAVQADTTATFDPAWKSLPPFLAYRAYVTRELGGGSPFAFLDHLRLQARIGSVTRETRRHNLPRYEDVERRGGWVWFGWLLQAVEIFVACFLAMAWAIYGSPRKS